MLERFLDWRFWPLFIKELNELRRNRRLVGMMLLPPTLNLVLLGFAMNPEVTDLRLGVVDESKTVESRELISAFSESRSFKPSGSYQSIEELSEELQAGKLAAGIVIPSNFATKRARNETAEIQFLVDSVDSNTASIAGGYASRIISSVNERIGVSRTSVQPAKAVSRVSLFYNPGLENSWFIVTGIVGLLLVMLGAAIAAASMVKEKEVGTVEQLLMTPAGSAEIILAKMAPIFLTLSLTIGLSVLTELSPVKHFAQLARGVMLKGVGLDVLYPNFLALVAFTVVLVGVSAWRFRKQLN